MKSLAFYSIIAALLTSISWADPGSNDKAYVQRFDGEYKLISKEGSSAICGENVIVKGFTLDEVLNSDGIKDYAEYERKMVGVLEFIKPSSMIVVTSRKEELEHAGLRWLRSDSGLFPSDGTRYFYAVDKTDRSNKGLLEIILGEKSWKLESSTEPEKEEVSYRSSENIFQFRQRESRSETLTKTDRGFSLSSVFDSYNGSAVMPGEHSRTNCVYEKIP